MTDRQPEDEISAEEELMARILTGDVSPESDEARRAFVAHPELEAELKSLIRARDALDATALQDEILSEVEGSSWSLGEERLDATLREALGETPSLASARRRPWATRAAVVLAAAAAVIALALFLPLGGGERPDDRMLLGPPLQGAAPSGVVDEYGTFTWELERPEGYTFAIAIFDASRPNDAPLHEKGDLEEARWTPPDDLILPRSIRWMVQLMAPGPGGGTPTQSYEATAELR